MTVHLSVSLSFILSVCPCICLLVCPQFEFHVCFILCFSVTSVPVRSAPLSVCYVNISSAENAGKRKSNSHNSKI